MASGDDISSYFCAICPATEMGSFNSRGIWISSSSSNVNTWVIHSSGSLFPSRLHLPAAWITLSIPASSLYTAGKSKSTPASTRLVDISRHGSPDDSRLRISFKISFLCFGYIKVDKWYVPRPPMESQTRCTRFLLFRIQRTCCRPSSSFTRCFWDIRPASCIFVLLKKSYWPFTSGHSSSAFSSCIFAGKKGCRDGWVAVQITAVQ